MQKVIDIWNVLQELWDECLETKLEPDIKGRIIGVKHQMGTFDYFYDVYLGEMLLKHIDNLSCAIQTSHMSAADSQLVAALTTDIDQSPHTRCFFFILEKVQESCHRN